MMDVGLIAGSFWKAILQMVDEVRRTPTLVIVTMVVIAVAGTLIAQLLR